MILKIPTFSRRAIRAWIAMMCARDKLAPAPPIEPIDQSERRVRSTVGTVGIVAEAITSAAAVVAAAVGVVVPLVAAVAAVVVGGTARAVLAPHREIATSNLPEVWKSWDSTQVRTALPSQHNLKK